MHTVSKVFVRLAAATLLVAVLYWPVMNVVESLVSL
jgi:hypothetical protein